MSLPGYEAVTADAVRLLDEWVAPDQEQEALRLGYLAHLERHPDGAAKGGPPAHLTASCLVVDDTARHVLLTLHPKVGRWVQLGGHLEATDESVAGAALREAVEESGIATGQLTLRPGPVQLDRHALGGGFSRCTEHLDLRWVVVAAPGAQIERSAESDDLRWWPVDALPADLDPSLRQLIAAALPPSSV